ncbi:MAG: TonB-dependent receptor [Hyphomicrobiaceae bacterium]
MVVETEDAVGEPSDVDTDDSAPQIASQQSVVAPQVVPPSDTIDTTPSTIQGVIFDAPVEGDTLNRGTTGVDGYFASGTSVATKTNTLIMDIPGLVTIITKELADDQGATLLGEALLYVPGIAVQQGEGHRDQITFRGQETTADFFVDGVRDDIQTFRDLYNAQTIEVLKGPLAMIFGRGGGGGVINRVTKKADGIPVYEGTFQTGSYGRARFTADVGQAVTPDFAVRLNAMYEDSATFRDFSYLERYGINPTVGIKLGQKTSLHLSYEYKVHDQNVDRGGPSINGRPFAYPIERFWGQPLVSFTEFDGHVATATLQHEFDSGLQMRNHAFYAKYNKLYQNIMPESAVTGDPLTYTAGGYQSDTDRENFVNQTDFSYRFRQHSHVRHTVVAGTEVVVQDNFEFRNGECFNVPNPCVAKLPGIPASNPTIFNPVFFADPERRRQTDVTTLSAFIQDQVEITPYFEIIGGVRFEHFDVEFSDPLGDGGAGVKTSRIDNKWSPRIGAVIKPWKHFHWYVSYAKSFLPQNGDNFGNFDLDAAGLEPEEFTNYETGFKWTLAPRLLLTGATYQLDRDNQAVTIGQDEFANGLTRTQGAEIEISGYVTDNWQVFGGYAYTDSEILDAGEDDNLVGNSVESVPVNMFSMWNKYQIDRQWGVGLGIIHQSSWFAEAGNNVEIPGYTRFDGAIYYDHDENWGAQLNVVNIFDTEYWISSHNDENISYGAPLSAYVTIKAKM